MAWLLATDYCSDNLAQFVISAAETCTTDLVAFKSLDPSGHWQVAGLVAGGKLALTTDIGGGWSLAGLASLPEHHYHPVCVAVLGRGGGLLMEGAVGSSSLGSYTKTVSCLLRYPLRTGLDLR
jgi:hypothetical protein